MRKENLLLFIILIFIVIFSFNVSALNPDCGNNTILALYSQDNSHAAAYNGSSATGTQIAICYNDYATLFSKDNTHAQNPWQCAGSTNLVIKLSSSTNAHVGNSSSNYVQNICYENIKCEVRNSCTSGETPIASLSATENAHISKNINYYPPYKLCCQQVTSVSLSASWKDFKTGLEKDSASEEELINLSVGALNVVDNENIIIKVYNESNNLELASFSAQVKNNKVDITKNLTLDILKGKAGMGAGIYFNASYNSIIVKSKILNITKPARKLSNPRWAGEDISKTMKWINGEGKTRLYVETNGINDGEKLIFRIYELGKPLVIKEINYSVNSNLAYSPAALELQKFIINSPSIDDEFYFIVIDPVTGLRVTSETIEYQWKNSNLVPNCHSEELNRNKDLCDGSMLGEPLLNDCGFSIQETFCSYDEKNNVCNAITEGRNVINQPPVTICVESSRREYTICENGWKNLKVDVTTKDTCGGNGKGCSEGIYRVPCREVALLPIFSFGNIMIATGIIIIVYLIIFKRKNFNRVNKTLKKGKK